MITHKGWRPSILVKPDTDLNAPEFIPEFLERFEKTRQQIDSLLDIRRR